MNAPPAPSSPSCSDRLRAQLAPRDAIEESLVLQIVFAAEEIDRLARKRPEEPDSRWLRLFSLAQSLFHRSHAAFVRHRKQSESSPMPACPVPASPPSDLVTRQASLPPIPAKLEPAPEAAPSPAADVPPNLNRRDRRRLAAMLRSAPDRRERMYRAYAAARAASVAT